MRARVYPYATARHRAYTMAAPMKRNAPCTDGPLPDSEKRSKGDAVTPEEKLDDDDDDEEEEEEEPVFDSISALLAYGMKRNALNALHFAVWGKAQKRGKVTVSRALMNAIVGTIGKHIDKTGPPLIRIRSIEMFGLPVEFEHMVGAAFGALSTAANLKSPNARKAWFAHGGKMLVAEIVCPAPRKFEFAMAFAADD